MIVPRWTDNFLDGQKDSMTPEELKILCEEELVPKESNLTKTRRIIKFINIKED